MTASVQLDYHHRPQDDFPDSGDVFQQRLEPAINGVLYFRVDLTEDPGEVDGGITAKCAWDLVLKILSERRLAGASLTENDTTAVREDRIDAAVAGIRDEQPSELAVPLRFGNDGAKRLGQ